MIRNFGLQIAAGVLAFTTLVGVTQPAVAQCGCGEMLLGDATKISMQGFNPAWDLTQEDSIYLTVNVPEAALVKVNGDNTAMVGATRYFVIRHLDPKREYKFVISAETLNAASIALEESTTVTLAAGERHSVTLAPYKRKVVKEAEDKGADNASAE